MNDLIIPVAILSFSIVLAIYYGHRTPKKAHEAIDAYQEHVKELSYEEVEEEKVEEKESNAPGPSMAPIITGLVTLVIVIVVVQNILSTISESSTEYNTTISENTTSYAFSALESEGAFIPIVSILGCIGIVGGIFFSLKPLYDSEPETKSTVKSKKIIRRQKK